MNVRDELLIQSAFMSGESNHFLVVEWDSQPLRYQFSYLLVGRTMFPRDGDDNAWFDGLSAGLASSSGFKGWAWLTYALLRN